MKHILSDLLFGAFLLSAGALPFLYIWKIWGDDNFFALKILRTDIVAIIISLLLLLFVEFDDKKKTS